MRNILVLAYAVSPTRGSEYGIAWEYINNMSKDNHLTVLYGCSGDNLGDIGELDEYLKSHKVPNVDFIPVLPSKWTKKLNYLNERHLFVYSFYFSYQNWHKQVFKKVEELLSKRHFDIIHYLNPLGYREPGYLWKLDYPYMWGPISGTMNYPICLFKTLNWKDRIKFSMRSVVNRYQLRNKKRLKLALNNTDLLLTCTTEDQNAFYDIHKKDSDYLPEFALTGKSVVNHKKFENLNEKIRLVFVGSLDGRKAVIIQLMALARLKSKDRFHLDIVGDGPKRAELEKFVREHDLNDVVSFHGRIPREEVGNIFDQSHLNVITSLGEANTVTIFEAISRGVPSISLDHCGMHDTVTNEVGYPIAIHSLDQVIDDIAKTLDQIASNPFQLKDKAEAVVSQSLKYQWDDRRVFFNRCYDICIKKHIDSKTR